ncbi:MAG TPA: ATP:cob(I)alamin adenosyltransferase, partial [Alphaproteobacteria bacterium]|nr:ATP:cob(I)alamin adenosyltransferase [Alphaproteobacteria bacterium]
RTVVRRAERIICEFVEEEQLSPPLLAYINRLSDHLFVAARYLNNRGQADVLWDPGKNQ